ncbi:MAG: glycine betaine ABC transporter substrate-binding protein [Dokdonella sp.]|uniref:ABC transporter permease/substrate-binding protein n=1 Tax=Dokdonella sp. TaxID=2291710 RepID=UPI0032637C5E
MSAPRVIAALCGFMALSFADAAPVQVGSKNFTESIVLAEIVRAQAQRDGVSVDHRQALGGTRILWRALEEGSIDLYPEYTGTLTRELVPGIDPNADLATIRRALEPKGIGVSESLGFEDGYALGMREDVAARDSIATISDLRRRPDLRFGLSSEFVDREDGWPGLKRAYALPQTVRGMDHDLAYRALADDAVDVVDLYTTDAQIPYRHLRVLQDDRHYFPGYQAVLVYRLQALRDTPALKATIDALAGRIDVDAMRAMNAEVTLTRRSERAVAAAFLGLAQPSATDGGRFQRIMQRTLEHLVLVGVSLSLAILVALPLGVFAARRRRLGQLVIAATGILQTVPSLAMFVFMIPLFGIGAAPAVAALFFYSLLPIVRNTHAGLVGIAPELRESAAALGLPPHVRLRRIELPLATRSILAGIKTAAVINVGTATLGALIGAGGYGQPIITGIRLDDLGLILEGAVPAAVLALLVQGVFEAAERWLTPRGLRLAARE